jgi:hypothetical protein
MAAVSINWRRNDWQPIGIRLVGEALAIKSGLDAKRPVDPRLAAIGKRRQIVSLAPDQ